MQFRLEPELDRYLAAHCSGYDDAAARITTATEALGEPAVMLIAKEQYALFRFIAAHLGCRRVLDLGTFTGLSALAFAQGMGPGGRVTTIDRQPAWIATARAHWKSAGVADRIEAISGEALDALERFAADPAERFDLVFVDIDKARVAVYVDLALRVLAPSGLVIVDNALWHGWVLDPSRTDADSDGMRRFNDRIVQDPRVDVVMLPIADGITLIRRRN